MTSNAPKQQQQRRYFYRLGEESQGPIPADDIIKALIAAELQVTHRVSVDGTAWTAICNEEYFETRIKELIDQAKDGIAISDTGITSAPENTTSFDLGRVTQGIAQQLKQAEELSQSTHDLNGLRKLVTAIGLNKKRVIVEKPVAVQTVHPDDSDEYVAHPDSIKASKHRKRLMILSGISLVLALAFGYQVREEFVQREAAELARVTQEAEEKAAKDRLFAAYEKALNRPGTKHDFESATTLLEVAEAMMKQKDYSGADAVLNRIISLEPNKASVELKAKAHTALGFSNFEQGKLIDANRDFDQAIKSNPNQMEVFYVKGIIALRLGKLAEAEASFLRAVELGGRTPPVLLALFEAVEKIEQSTPNSNYERVARVDQVLSAPSLAQGSHASEVLIARILAAVLRQRDSEARILADSFLSLNPDASIKSAENRRDEVSWSTVYRWCTTIYSKASDKTIASAVVASCLLQVKNNAAAEKFAKGAFDRSAFDPQIRGMYAFTLQANGKFSEAKALFSGQDDRILPKLALAALAKICEKEKNLGCAQRYWARLLEHDPADPIAFLGLIEARAELQDVDGAKQVIKQSLSRQPASTTDDLQRLDRKLRAKGISLW